MKLSTKGQYAVIAIVDLAQQQETTPTALADIAARQQLPISYLEQLFVKLRRNGLVQSRRGSSGGYQLSRPMEDICILDIMRAVEEPIRTTRCQPDTHTGCQGGRGKCLTHALWDGLSDQILGYLRGVTVADVCKRTLPIKEQNVEAFVERGEKRL